MIIRIAGAAARLEDVENLKGFKVVADSADPTALSAALAVAGRLDGEHAWINEAWLRANTASQGADWQANFEKMLAYAQSKGWIENGSIRAHIERPG